MLPDGILSDVPLAPLTTLGVGGAARYFLATQSLSQVRAALAWAHAGGMPTFVLGGGSNILVADRGFDGLVLQYHNKRLGFSTPAAQAQSRPCRLLLAGASVAWTDAVQAAHDAGCGGIECLAGIPGTVGAAPVQNIGAYGQELSQTLVAVHALHRATGEMHRHTADTCGMGYRTSHFKGAWRDTWLITRVDLALTPGAAGHVGYGELQAFFAAATTAPRIAEVQAAVLRLRARKSMVLSDPQDPNRRSVGSFFMNPCVSEEKAAALLAGHGAGMPVYPAPHGRKLSAAWLIERSGFGRGFVMGEAGVSSRHSLALINRGQAKATDMVTLARHIRQGVHARFGVTLVPEAQLIGFSQADTQDLFADLP